MKLLAVATHPIQYQAPLFRALAREPQLDLAVAFALLPRPEAQGVGFGVPFEWDVPLLDGYRSFVLELAGRAPALGSFWALRARGVRGLLRRERPDALLLTGWNSFVLVQALAAARSLGVPVLMRCESNDLRPRPAASRWLQRLLLAQCRALLAIGRANRDFLVARGVPPERILDAPYFVDNAAFAAAAERERPRRAELRRRFGVADDRFCFLFAGKLIAKKRPGDILDAFSRSEVLRQRAALLVVGSGELAATLERRAAEEGLPVRFAGFLNQTEIPRAYVAADALVLPSDAGETWGLVVNEAMACGLPAIVSDRVGCRADLIRDGETGWGFECGDVGGLARAMSEAAGDADRSAALGVTAQRRLFAENTVARSVAAIVAAVERVNGAHTG